MILVTGGAGYIGSHTCLELLNSYQEVVVLDNFQNSFRSTLAQVENIAGRKLNVVTGDIRDEKILSSIFESFPIEAVIHFAGLKSIEESTRRPIEYFDCNVSGTLNLIRVMEKSGCKKLVFSSSASVYGTSATAPIREDCPLSPINPYGESKMMVELILGDLVASDDWSAVILRYFNPVGAHQSGLIGENPLGSPGNLMPLIARVAHGDLEYLQVFGGDYPTSDGTGIRDYIHVVDLAKGHIKSLEALKPNKQLLTVNLGTGVGHSVLEVVECFERISKRKVPYKIVARRPGDVDRCFADPSLAKKILGWETILQLDQMCADAWRWQLRAHDNL